MVLKCKYKMKEAMPANQARFNTVDEDKNVRMMAIEHN